MKKTLLILIGLSLAACSGLAEKSSISVMSFNIRLGTGNDGSNSWEFRRDAAVRMINIVNPDIIGLQEALYDQNEFLAGNLPQYEMVGVGRDDGEKAGEFMTVLFNKELYDLLDAGHFWLSETPDEVSRGWDGACNRMVTWVKLQEKGGGRPFWFFNTHLDHMGEQARREGVKLLADRIDGIAGKGIVFVTGDFNAVPDDEVLRPMFERFGSARDNAPETDHEGTFNGFGNVTEPHVIDFIFYRNAVPKTFRTVTEDFGVPFVSDHYPIVAQFEF